jgi:radical SAM protein with 4Fe4S-binding SPASM domain
MKLVRHMEELGFRKILLTPATDLAGKSNGIREADLPRAFAAFEALAGEYERRVLAGEPVAETWFPRLVGRVLSGERRTQFCSGGRDYLGVAADGKVALCYRFFEEPELAMGSVQGGIDRRVTERLLASPVDERTVCSRCWARHYCGGGCHHDNHTSQGAIETPNPIACELFRHGMGRALEAWARLTRAGRLAGRRAASVSSGGMERRPFDGEARPKGVAGTHARTLGSERIVYDPATHEVVVLNETAAFVLERCDGAHSVAEILRALEERYAAPRERLSADLQGVLADLAARKLLQG